MTSSPSVLSLSAAGLYCLVLLACAAAAFTARSRAQPPRHIRQWLMIALLFGGLIALRLSNFEEVLRASLRADLRADAAYDNRRNFQRPLAAGAIVAFVAAGSWAIYRTVTGGSGRRHLAAGLAGLAGMAMIGLAALRLVSLHQIDALLYGPLKLNWIIDIGASLFVAGAAIYYIRLLSVRRG